MGCLPSALLWQTHSRPGSSLTHTRTTKGNERQRPFTVDVSTFCQYAPNTTRMQLLDCMSVTRHHSTPRHQVREDSRAAVPQNSAAAPPHLRNHLTCTRSYCSSCMEGLYNCCGIEHRGMDAHALPVGLRCVVESTAHTKQETTDGRPPCTCPPAMHCTNMQSTHALWCKVACIHHESTANLHAAQMASCTGCIRTVASSTATELVQSRHSRQ
jgi:hypothetical protein